MTHNHDIPWLLKRIRRGQNLQLPSRGVIDFTAGALIFVVFVANHHLQVFNMLDSVVYHLQDPNISWKILTYISSTCNARFINIWPSRPGHFLDKVIVKVPFGLWFWGAKSVRNPRNMCCCNFSSTDTLKRTAPNKTKNNHQFWCTFRLFVFSRYNYTAYIYISTK